MMPPWANAPRVLAQLTRGLLVVLSLLLLWPAICGQGALGARVPSAGSIAADLLVRAANNSDVGAARRLLGSSSFQGAWLTQACSSGETPLQAALRAGLPELVALLVTHPEFDDETIRRERQRKALASHAGTYFSGGDKDAVVWAISVLIGIKTSRVAQDELVFNPRLALTHDVWYLPRPGEWMPPATLAEMGVVLPMKPSFPRSALDDLLTSAATFEMLKASSLGHGESALGLRRLRRTDVEALWYLLVSRAQATDDEQRAALDRHLRSIGWTLFFRGSKTAMALHYYVIDHLASRLQIVDLLTGDEGEKGKLSAYHLGSIRKYQGMGTTLGTVWQKLGTWVSSSASD